MRELASAIVLFFVTFQLLAQQQELVEQLSICSYQGKSYLYTKQVNITATPSCSFVFSATANSTFSIKAAAAATTPKTIAPSTDRNFVREETVLIEAVKTEDQVSGLLVEQKATQFRYWDGLGRVYETVDMGSSPSKADNIVATLYDNMGYKVKEYLPYAKAQNNGAFRSQYDAESKSFYSATPKVSYEATQTFAQNTFENSSLNRIASNQGPGSDWFANTRKKQKQFLIDASGAFIKWTYVDDSTPPTMGIYDSLQVTVSIDEENHVTRDFIDKQGSTILKQSLESGDYLNTPASTTWLSTYYIYDDVGFLKMVVPPEATARLNTEYITDNTVKTNFIRRWCFQYRYDKNGNLIQQWIPGWTDWQYIIHDKWNRERLSQTPAQRERNEWTFTKYDRYNRKIMMGLWITATSYNQIKSDIESSAGRFESPVNSPEGYTLTSMYPTAIDATNLIALTYYDNYAFLGYTGWDPQGNSAYSAVTVNGIASVSDFLTAPVGKETGSKVKILETSNWLNIVTRYDGRYQTAQTVSKNNLGGFDRVTTKYNFSGLALIAQIYHTSTGSPVTMIREFDYDHQNRPLKIFQTVDGGPRIQMIGNSYNEIGQLVEKNTHSTDNGITFLQSMDYRYNIRGWLTNINNSALSNDGLTNDDATDLFGMELLYNPASQPAISGYPSSTVPKLYDGSITAVKWKTNTLEPGGAGQEKIYGYEYDKLSRLKKAYYATNNGGTWSGNTGMFNEGIKSYDRNGNILGIDRNGKLNGGLATLDNTTYSYNYTASAIPNFNGISNRLLAVSDAASTFGFKDATAQITEEYKYDPSGNLIFDHNKSLSNIVYNHLNLPKKVELTRSTGAIDRIIFTYDAAGVKLKKELYKDGTSGSNGTLVSTTEYDADFQYDQIGSATRQLSFITHPEGRTVKQDGTYDYEYFHTDHIGNVRLTYGLSKEFDSYRATMENPPAPSQLGSDENSTFKNISTTRYQDPVFNFTTASTDVTDPKMSSQTNAYLNRPLGPAISLHLNIGDAVNMEVMAKYNQPTNGTTTIDPGVFIAALATGTFGYNVGEVAFSSFNSNALAIPGIGGASSVLPKAYLAYIFFDENFQFVPSGASAVSISTAAYNSFEKLTRSFTAPQNGYLYIYVANESNTSTSNVYFDEMYINRKGTNNKLQVKQATDYYPFGLTFDSYTRENSVPNRFKFQGQEHVDDLDLGWDSFKWRNHQPDIGRFFNVDPLADKYVYNSPYAFSENKVTNHIELEGLEAIESKTKYTNNSNGTVSATSTTTTTTSKLAFTAAITNGTVSVHGKAGDVEVGGTIKQQETDIVGFRDNEFILGGHNSKGEYIERTGLSGGIIVAAGFEGTAVNGERTSEENFFTVPFMKNSSVTDLKENTNTFEQSIDVFGITVGFGLLGVDVGLSIKEDQTMKQTTSTYKGNMDLKTYKGSSNPNSSHSPGISWQGISTEDASRIKEYLNKSR